MRDATVSVVRWPVALLDGYPADPDFPQLEIASDPVRMLEILRAHLRPLPGRDTRILDCRPFRFRCRQATSRCVLQYTLRLFEPGTGREWDHWATGLIFAGPGSARRAWLNLRAAPSIGEIPPSWRCFEPMKAESPSSLHLERFACSTTLAQRDARFPSQRCSRRTSVCASMPPEKGRIRHCIAIRSRNWCRI